MTESADYVRVEGTPPSPPATLTTTNTEGPSLNEVVALRRMRERHPKLYRKLLKAAKQSRGLQPIRSEKADEKRAMRHLTLSVTGSQSGRQVRKAKKQLRRAFKAELHTPPIPPAA